jgi:16S rRNA A1518/A1519 N6-dimethyltransferase RsmA/KsgA/DIM1 with predicted DNA glycosylase/AP lyase activity
MLLNNLKSNFDTLLLLKTFKKFNINPNVRAEQLSATQLFQLYECLSKNDATH